LPILIPIRRRGKEEAYEKKEIANRFFPY